jgi:cobalt-zinc-cadmium efflux system outer membrane protein
MKLFRAAAAAAVAVLGVSTPVRATETLRLEDAFQRVIVSHPDLAVLRLREAALSAERIRAAQRPALHLGASAENVFGTGAASTLDAAEITLSLSSVLERGGKRAARIALADGRFDAVELLREAKRLDLLAEVARRYLDAVAAVAQAEIARADVAQRERALSAARQRVTAGGAPESVALAAMASGMRAAGDVQRAERASILARRRLALLWGDTHSDFEVDEHDLAALPKVVEFNALASLLQRTPELRAFAHEARLREARLQLARSSRTPDLEWQIGLRRLQTESDWALIGSVSLPLGSAARAAPEIDAVSAEIEALALERDGSQRALEATLAEAQGRLEAAVAEATQLDLELIPTLQRAEQSAEQAYRRGAVSYLEWAQLQSETQAAQRQRLAASLEAHRALIELQRLTGETLYSIGNATQESAP